MGAALPDEERTCSGVGSDWTPSTIEVALRGSHLCPAAGGRRPSPRVPSAQPLAFFGTGTHTRRRARPKRRYPFDTKHLRSARARRALNEPGVGVCTPRSSLQTRFWQRQAGFSVCLSVSRGGWRGLSAARFLHEKAMSDYFGLWFIRGPPAADGRSVGIERRQDVGESVTVPATVGRRAVAGWAGQLAAPGMEVFDRVTCHHSPRITSSVDPATVLLRIRPAARPYRSGPHRHRRRDQPSYTRAMLRRLVP